MNISTTINSLSQHIFVLLAVLLFSGCAVLPQQQKAPVNSQQVTIDQTQLQEDGEGIGWWQIGFHRPFDSDNEVQWQYDAFIALKIFKPIVDHNNDIDLWRFHRRAAADDSGHKFSFIFYSTRKSAEQIYQLVSEDAFVQQLLSQDHLSRLSFYDVNNELRTDIEETSDKKWPLELQKAWPYFIMGTSRTWLDLVEHFYTELQLSEEAQLDEQLEGFKQVSADIDLLWKHNGNHAFLHHLNALFAYKELYVIESQLRRF